jgi:ribonuclease P protein component
VSKNGWRSKVKNLTLALAVFEFTKSARLTRPEEFKRALRLRPVVRSNLFFCHYVQSGRSDDLGFSRLGLIVPKRFAKKATTRNAIKRVIREAYRICRASLPSGDLVIRLRSAPSPDSLSNLKSSVRSDIDSMLRRMSRDR